MEKAAALKAQEEAAAADRARQARQAVSAGEQAAVRAEREKAVLEKAVPVRGEEEQRRLAEAQR